MPFLSVINICHAFIMSCASLIFFLAYKKRKELLLWFMSCTLTTIGYIINAFPLEAANEVNPIAMILFSVGTSVLFYAVLKEYYHTFLKDKRLQKSSITYTAALSGTVTFSFYYIMLGLIILCFVLIIRLYTASMEEISATASKLDNLASKLKISLTEDISE